MKKAVFLDRDGVINQRPPEGGYVTRWEEMQLLPGVPEAIVKLTRAGYFVFVASNQRCVAKGLVAASDLESMHERLCQQLAAKGALITEVYYCPHEKYPPCDCRKPSPGMLLAAARRHKLDLTASWMIGDSEVDVQAGRNAGCKTARILEHQTGSNEHADVLAGSLGEAVEQLLAREQ
jgi:D-glycero-D-manno-heptose 1,7-bisphosphate phosphatase